MSDSMITKEMIDAAEEMMTGLQANVYFNKLASLGVIPATDKEAETLWKLGDRLLQEQPRLSEAGRATKQASLEMFGRNSSPLAQDGCSLESHAVVEELCKDPNIVKAAHLLLAAQNVA